MHILLMPSWYSNPLNPTQGSFFRDQALALKKKGIKVGIIAPIQRSITTYKKGHVFEFNYRIRPVEIDCGIPVIKSYGWGMASLKFINILIWCFQAQRLYKKYVKQYGKPDLIHVHSAIWAGFAAVRLSKKNNIPYVITEHFSKFVTRDIKKWQEPYLKECFSGASEIIAVSSHLAQHLKPYLDGHEIIVIPNLVDLSFFRLPHKSRNENQRYTILCVAYLIPRKGIDILIKAFSKAFLGDCSVYLEIVGDGDQRQYLEDMVYELDGTNQIVFSGLLNKVDVRSAMWKANLFVLPSYAETFGVVLIEAMSTGLKVVSTRCGCTDKFVTSEVGLLVDSGDIDGLACALIESRMNKDLNRKKEKLIRQYIEDNFSEKIVSEQLLEVYKGVSI